MIGSSELLLTMGALIIFGLYAMQANRSMVTADTWSIENETQLEAAKIAESIIHQAAALPFDREVVDGPLPQNDPTGLTLLTDFGLPNTEKDVRPNAIVFDHFHGAQFTESGIFGEYSIEADVQYVNTDGSVALERTLRKRLEVTVRNQNLNSPVVMRFTKSYH